MDIIKLKMDKEHFDFITPYRAKFNKKANELGLYSLVRNITERISVA